MSRPIFPLIVRRTASAGGSGSSIGSFIQKLGIAQQTVLTTTSTQQAAGGRVVQITYNLTGTYPVGTAASTGSWTNPTNAQGVHNGTNATNANTVTVAASGVLTMTYAAQANKTGLAITNVTLNGYWGNAAGVTAPCTYLIEYSIDGATWTTLQTGSASVTAASPTTATNVTALIAGSWANVSSFRVRATYTGAASATPSTLSVDAFELVVTANTTQVQ